MIGILPYQWNRVMLARLTDLTDLTDWTDKTLNKRHAVKTERRDSRQPRSVASRVMTLCFATSSVRSFNRQSGFRRIICFYR